MRHSSNNEEMQFPLWANGPYIRWTDAHYRGRGRQATMGVALPSADFMPLQWALAKDYNTIMVEYFGVVFSTSTAYYRRNPCLCFCLAPPRKDSATPWFDQIVHSSEFMRDTMSLPYL
jgi:hypothetical protein